MKLQQPQDYQAAMMTRYAIVAARLAQCFPTARVEHIGSSALPGALSKGDLDIGLIVAPADLEACVAALQSQGYLEKQGTLRTEALCMLGWLESAEEHAVQVVGQGSEFEHLFLGFRDRLLANPALVEAYNRLKTESAPLGETGYRAAKSEFIESVLASPG